MSKKYYTLPDRTEQPTIHDDFDFEDGFCSRLNKIQGIADLLFCMGESDFNQISSTGCFGLHNILAGAAEEIRTICYKMFEWEETAHVRERALTLERIMKHFISYLEDPDEKPDLKTMAANLRVQLERGAQ